MENAGDTWTIPENNSVMTAEYYKLVELEVKRHEHVIREIPDRVQQVWTSIYAGHVLERFKAKVIGLPPTMTAWEACRYLKVLWTDWLAIQTERPGVLPTPVKKMPVDSIDSIYASWKILELKIRLDAGDTVLTRHPEIPSVVWSDLCSLEPEKKTFTGYLMCAVGNAIKNAHRGVRRHDQDVLAGVDEEGNSLIDQHASYSNPEEEACVYELVRRAIPDPTPTRLDSLMAYATSRGLSDDGLEFVGVTSRQFAKIRQLATT